MIKKLLTTAALCVVFVGAFAQNEAHYLTPVATSELKVGYSTSAAPIKNNVNNSISQVTVNDTLFYFFNKHIYRNAASANFIGQNVPFQFTSTPVSALSSRFLNSSNVVCTGAECIAARKNKAGSTTISGNATTTLSVKLKLCLLSGGYPVLPGIDSLVATLTTTTISGYLMGGNWINGAHLLTTDFAIVGQNAQPTSSGDTVTFYMTNGSIPSATAASIPAGSKFGEGLSSFRTAGNFSNTAGYWGTGSIPYQTSSFEYCLSPRVTYTAAASHAAIPVTVCPQTAVNYNNTSTAVISNRQFNFNQFLKVWKPFLSPVPAADSVFIWNAGDGQGNFYGPNHTHFFSTIGIYNGTLTANVRNSAYVYSGVPSTVKNADTYGSTIQTILACGALGVNNLSVVEGINIYPNPTVTGLVNITNLSNECTIELINMLGQTVSKERVTTANHTADYSNLPKGTYFIKISANNEKTKVSKLILN